MLVVGFALILNTFVTTALCLLGCHISLGTARLRAGKGTFHASAKPSNQPTAEHGSIFVRTPARSKISFSGERHAMQC